MRAALRAQTVERLDLMQAALRAGMQGLASEVPRLERLELRNRPEAKTMAVAVSCSEADGATTYPGNQQHCSAWLA